MRRERLAELLKREISQIFLEKVSDPRIGFVSITKVDVSPDLENAQVYVSIFGDEVKKKQTMEGLRAATGFIRGEVGQLLEMRVVPKINFVRDDSLEDASRVLGIISKLEKERHGKNIRRNKKSAKKS